MSSTTPLPTPRELLTDLISTLSAISLDHIMSSQNVLQHAAPEVRSLLTTLHIIFPHLLLPALDLLDRQLVTKAIQRPLHPTQANPLSNVDNERAKENSFYMVQSSQSTSRHRHQKSYIVRLHAWNCTCASFVFSAFAPPTSNETTVISNENFQLFQKAIGHDGGGDSTDAEDWKWEFGGASLDGKDGGAVPACKHLLAVVLADRWGALRGMVTERWVNREEMAGLGAGF